MAIKASQKSKMSASSGNTGDPNAKSKSSNKATGNPRNKSSDKKRPADAVEQAVDEKPPAKKPMKKPAPVFKPLLTDPGVSVPIDISFEGDLPLSSPSKAGGFTHRIKLEAPGSFTLIKTIVFPKESELAGYQAIVVRPAKAFPFMDLPAKVRARVYDFYLAPSGKLDGKIVIDGRRPSNKEVFAKTYASGSKNRIALLTVSKEVNEETVPILYAYALRFETTAILLDFLSQATMSVRSLLRVIDIKLYSKSSARNALNSLVGASNLTKLRIENGMPTTDPGDAGKSAKLFYQDASRFLHAFGTANSNKTAGVGILNFGKYAFTSGGEKGDAKEPWDKEDIGEFMEQLRGKLR